MIKPQIISDINKKSLNIKNILLKKISSNNFQNKNLTVVIGGDGFMLQTLKRNKNSNKFFYGINSGNYGFLMNKFSFKDILKNSSNRGAILIRRKLDCQKEFKNDFSNLGLLENVSVGFDLISK